MKKKRGNVGLVVLVMVLFIVVIALAGYIAYDKLGAKDIAGNNNEIVNNNQENIQNNDKINKFQINSIADAEKLMEKYTYTNGVKRYFGINSNRDELAIFQTNSTEKKDWKTINALNSFKNSDDYLLFSGEDGTTTEFYSYGNVQKTKNELFGANVEDVKKGTITGCPKALVYLEDLNGFVIANAPCGSGVGIKSNNLEVYSYENFEEEVTIYTKQVIVSENAEFKETETTKNKYTFKIQGSQCYLDKVEQIAYSVEKD